MVVSFPETLFSVLDAQGKLQEGVFLGNLLALGNYPSCMDVDVKSHKHNDVEVEGFRSVFNLLA